MKYYPFIVAILLYLSTTFSCKSVGPAHPENTTIPASAGIETKSTRIIRGDANEKKVDNINIAKEKQVEPNLVKPDLVEPNPELLYKKARLLYEQHDYEETLSILRELRIKYPYGIIYRKALLLSAKAEIQMDHPYRARYFLKKILEKKKKEREARVMELNAVEMLGDILKKERLFRDALSYYLEAIYDYNDIISLEERSKLYLSIAEILYLNLDQKDKARIFFKKIKTNMLDKGYLKKYFKLRKYLLWENISKNTLNIRDGNISAISLDGDDLWVGTWNGGIVRYSINNRIPLVFNSGKESIAPRSIRTIVIDSERVWVGGFEGLSFYSKRSGKWYRVKEFMGNPPAKVETIVKIKNSIFVGTLGRGIWKLDQNNADGKWMPVFNMEGLKFINTLNSDKKHLFVGTMDSGLFIIDLAKKSVLNLSQINPVFTPKNITTILVENEDTLWLGTYGKGLYRWNRKRNRIDVFSAENGYINEDWILCSAKGEKGLYFGTFGGGVIRVPYEFEGNKESIVSFSLKDGLASLDVASIAYSLQRVFFGTLGMGISIYYEEYE